MNRKNLIPVNPTETTRTYRFMRLVADTFNPLILDEILNTTDGQSWTLAGLIYAGEGPPAADLGEPGSFYLDTLNGILYENR